MADEAELPASDDEQAAKSTAEKARQWCAKIAAAEKAQAKWVERAKKVEKIYNDERDLTSGRARKFNILWSNVETLRPAVYMKTPKPQAVRRYRDRDPVARLASAVLERCLQTSCELYDFDHEMDQAVRDRLVPGRGQVWVSYQPTIAGEGDEAALEYEQAVAEYVPWRRFLHGPASTWADVPWVGREFYKTRREAAAWLKERDLNPNLARTLKLDVREGKEEREDDERGQARIVEVWDKASGKVLYVAPSSSAGAILGEVDPPVRFRDFFPCPRPMLATTTSKSLVPTPDYALYQDQAEELNRCTERISILQKALKVAGIYDSSHDAIADLLTSGDNRMIAVKEWAMLQEGGGAKGKIEWFPVEQVAAVLEGLYKIRDQAKQTLYEVSGIGDILRGSTDPDETATAQGIKAKWGSLRVRRIQKDVQRFAADVMRLKAEIMAEMFPLPLLLQMAGFDKELLAKYLPANVPPDAFMREVEKLLRSDTARSWRIDVETDSTLEPDEMEEKQTRTEFVVALTGFLKEAAPLMAQPEGVKVAGEILLFAVRGYGKADQLEQTIEQAVEAMVKQAEAARMQPPPPDPKLIEAQSRQQAAQADMMISAKKADADIEQQERKTQADVMSVVVKTQADIAASEAKTNAAMQNAAAQQAMKEGAPPQ